MNIQILTTAKLTGEVLSSPTPFSAAGLRKVCPSDGCGVSSRSGRQHVDDCRREREVIIDPRQLPVPVGLVEPVFRDGAEAGHAITHVLEVLEASHEPDDCHEGAAHEGAHTPVRIVTDLREPITVDVPRACVECRAEIEGWVTNANWHAANCERGEAGYVNLSWWDLNGVSIPIDLVEQRGSA